MGGDHGGDTDTIDTVLGMDYGYLLVIKLLSRSTVQVRTPGDRRADGRSPEDTFRPSVGGCGLSLWAAHPAAPLASRQEHVSTSRARGTLTHPRSRRPFPSPLHPRTGTTRTFRRSGRRGRVRGSPIPRAHTDHGAPRRGPSRRRRPNPKRAVGFSSRSRVRVSFHHER